LKCESVAEDDNEDAEGEQVRRQIGEKKLSKRKATTKNGEAKKAEQKASNKLSGRKGKIASNEKRTEAELRRTVAKGMRER
jgi:hypothetical protein